MEIKLLNNSYYKIDIVRKSDWEYEIKLFDGEELTNNIVNKINMDDDFLTCNSF